MIVDRIFSMYADDPRRKAGTGYPTGSRLGTCAAQLQMLRFSSQTKPEPPQPRAIMTWDEGNRTEEWLADVLKKAFPDVVGLRQEPFMLPVPLPEPWMADELRAQMKRRAPQEPRLWGRALDRVFRPPVIMLGPDGRVKMRLLQCSPECNGNNHAWACQKKSGFIVDETGLTVWAPTYVDFIIKHEQAGLAVIEVKSLSDFAFRRAALGQLDYGRQCQLVGLAEATGCAVVLVGVKKNTQHMIEILYSPKVDRVSVTLKLMNGQGQTFLVDKGKILNEVGEEVEGLPGDATWDRGEVWTPWQPGILQQIHERVRRVLFAKPGEWYREYGFSFSCPSCHGQGSKVCGWCKGTAISRGKKGGPCGYCKGKGRRDCDNCDEKGQLKVAEAQFPCSYCSCIRSACYPFVEATVDTKPHFRVTREQWVESGLSFVSPDTETPDLPIEPPGEPVETT